MARWLDHLHQNSPDGPCFVIGFGCTSSLGLSPTRRTRRGRQPAHGPPAAAVEAAPERARVRRRRAEASSGKTGGFVTRHLVRGESVGLCLLFEDPRLQSVALFIVALWFVNFAYCTLDFVVFAMGSWGHRVATEFG